MDSSGYSAPDMLRRIGLTSAAMGTLARVFKNKRLSLSTKLRIYNSCVLPVLLYVSEALTLLREDGRRLQAFDMRCQRRILGIRWFDRVTNEAVVQQTGSETLLPAGDIRYLVTSGASRTTHPLTSLYILPSTCDADIRPVSNGPAPGDVHGKPGYITWRWIRGLQLMKCGIQHPIDGFGRLYDSAPVSEVDDDDDDLAELEHVREASLGER